MYLNCKVKIPETSGKITIKTINGTPYVYYEYGRTYLKEKHYNTPKRTCIGKRDPEQPTFMCPNEKFLKFFRENCFQSRKTVSIGADVYTLEHFSLFERSYLTIVLMR